MGPVHRLVYTGKHYDALQVKESWQREMEQVIRERPKSSKPGHVAKERVTVKDGAAHPDGASRRREAWLSQQEDHRVRQRAALRDASQHAPGAEELPQEASAMALTPETLLLLAGAPDLPACAPALVALQLEEQALRTVFTALEEESAQMLGCWELWIAGCITLDRHTKPRQGHLGSLDVLPPTIVLQLEEQFVRTALVSLEDSAVEVLKAWMNGTPTLWQLGAHVARTPKPPERDVPKALEFNGGTRRKETWHTQQGARRNSQVTQTRRQSQLDSGAQATPPPAPRLLCRCRKPENPKEYYIQCRECKEWYHPRCIGTTQKQCEQEREAGGFTCPECII